MKQALKRAVAQFPIGTIVRYRPGTGTYGYEDFLEADGRVAAVLIGHTRTRVRVRMALKFAGDLPEKPWNRDRAVDAASLIKVVNP